MMAMTKGKMGLLSHHASKQYKECFNVNEETKEEAKLVKAALNVFYMAESLHHDKQQVLLDHELTAALSAVQSKITGPLPPYVQREVFRRRIGRKAASVDNATDLEYVLDRSWPLAPCEEGHSVEQDMHIPYLHKTGLKPSEICTEFVAIVFKKMLPPFVAETGNRKMLKVGLERNMLSCGESDKIRCVLITHGSISNHVNVFSLSFACCCFWCLPIPHPNLTTTVIPNHCPIHHHLHHKPLPP